MTHHAQLEAAPGGVSADAVALQRVAAGDVNALAVIYDHHATSLLRFAIHIIGVDDAEDLLQTTFLKAVILAPRYENRGNDARAWLFGIMAKLAHERRRAVARFTRAVGRFAQGARTAEPPPTIERLAIDRALALLDTPKRTAVVLADVEGYSCEQIATMMGVPIGTVWTRLHQGRKQLRRHYEGEAK